MSKYVPGLLDNSTKFPVFFKILEACIREGDRLLVFSQSLLTLNLLEDFLSERMLPGFKLKVLLYLTYTVKFFFNDTVRFFQV